MTYPYIVASGVSLCAVGWALNAALRRYETIDELVDKLEHSRADDLYPFVEGRDISTSWDDDALWLAIKGIDGIWNMRRDAGIMITIARCIKKEDKKCEDLAQEIVVKALYLRFLMTWICLAEEIAKIYVSSVPRIQARSCARLYCDLRASVDTVLSLHQLAVPSGL